MTPQPYPGQLAALADTPLFEGLPGFVFDDGGRKEAGYAGRAGAAGARAIAIATGIPFAEVHQALADLAGAWPGKSKLAQSIRGNPTPKRGIHVDVVTAYMKSLGWAHHKTGGKMRLNSVELPRELTLCYVRKHYFAIVKNTVRDAWDDRITARMVTENDVVIPPKPRVVYQFWTKD